MPEPTNNIQKYFLLCFKIPFDGRIISEIVKEVIWNSSNMMTSNFYWILRDLFVGITLRFVWYNKTAYLSKFMSTDRTLLLIFRREALHPV